MSSPGEIEQSTLDTLACAIDKRPKGAPSFFDVAPSIRDVSREPGRLVVEYDIAAAGPVEALVAAERLCCPQIGWELDHGTPPRLHIRATMAQLDLIEQSLTPGLAPSAPKS